MNKCISVLQFLESPKDTMFFHSDSDYEYTKEAISLGFQEHQDSGSITIEEYIERLESYLKMFEIQIKCNWCSKKYYRKTGVGYNNRFCSEKCFEDNRIDRQLDEQT